MRQNPFLDDVIPTGPSRSGVHNASPMDLLHGWCAGVFKNVLAGALAIILKSEETLKGNQIARIEGRMASMKRFPTCAGFAPTVFKNGAYKMILVSV